MATKQSNEAKALAMKGALVGFTVLGTIMGWAQFSAGSMANSSGTTVALGPSASQSTAPVTTAVTANSRTTAGTNVGALRQVSAAPVPAPAPLTRTRSSR